MSVVGQMVNRTMTIMLGAVLGCAPATGTHAPNSGTRADCRQRCDEYKSENEGGWSGLVKTVNDSTDDASKYRRCMDLCRGRE